MDSTISSFTRRSASSRNVQRAGSVDYVLQIARAEIQRARDEIDFLPASSAKSALLEIPNYVLDRTS